MKKYKRKKTASESLRHEIKRINWRKIGAIFGLIAFFYIIYRIACELNFYPILPIYLITATVLLIAFIILNRGFDRESPTPDMLSDDMSPEEKEAYIAADKRGKAAAKKLLYLIIPLLITVMLDMLWITYLEPYFG